jgi:hypothetical protein
MCDRSNRPTRSRTARCSSRIDAVLDRHQPAGELDQARAQSLVREASGVVTERWSDGSPVTPSVRRVSAGSSVGAPRLDRAARATRARSVSKVRVVPGASSNGIQRTSSNSWSWREIAADGFHEEIVDGLVDAGAALDERVLDVRQRSRDADLQAGLLGHLAEAVSSRLSPGSACPSAASTSSSRARAAGCRSRGDGVPSYDGRRSRPRRSRWRSSAAPRRRGGAGTPAGADSPGAGPNASRPTGGDALRPWPAASRGGARQPAMQAARANSPWGCAAPSSGTSRRRRATRPRGRGIARARGSTAGRIARQVGPRTWRRCCVSMGLNGTASVGLMQAPPRAHPT